MLSCSFTSAGTIVVSLIHQKQTDKQTNRQGMLQFWILALLATFPQSIECSAFYDKKFNIIKNGQFNENEYDSSNHTIYSVKAKSGDFKCWIPHVQDVIDITESNTPDEEKLEMEKSLAIDAIRNFNSANRGKFVIHKNGFWNYMIRFDHDIHQFHELDNFSGVIQISDETVYANFKLATWSDDDQTNSFASQPYYNYATPKDPYKFESDFELIKTEDGLKYVTQRIGNGEICDLTGLPRSVTIKYLCNDKVNTPSVRTVHEWKTCEYAIELVSDEFCSFEMWSLPKDLISNNINCITEEFDGKEIIDLQNVTFETFVSGIFLLKDITATTPYIKYSLLLTKNYDLWTIDIEGVKPNESSFEEMLTDISLGFHNSIRNKKLLFHNDTILRVIEPSDSFILVTKLFDMDGSYIGNIKVEKNDNGFIVSNFTDEQSAENTNFIRFHA